MSVADNAPPLPSPTEFARLLAEFVNARDHALETNLLDDHNAAEAKRMRLIESYLDEHSEERLLLDVPLISAEGALENRGEALVRLDGSAVAVLLENVQEDPDTGDILTPCPSCGALALLGFKVKP